MPNWGELLNEVGSGHISLDEQRRKYLRILSQYTDRNVICYYSGFLQKTGQTKTSIDDNDKNGFMQAIHKLDKGKGLDLILHTPGGDLAATESIVNYLKKIFGRDIRAIIPQIAMSAGTMIALSCKEIVMGKQSNLGPIDPQFGGIACHGVLDEFDIALQNIKADKDYVYLWQPIISKYHPTFLGDCKNAIEWSENMVETWLLDNMLTKEPKKAAIAKRILEKFGNHKETKSHARHIHIDECLQAGIKVLELENIMKYKPIEDCCDFQDCLLTVHHSYMLLFSNTPALKVIENNLGTAMIING